jgi:hypothetical protein
MEEEVKKMSYEELTNVAHQLSEQNRELYQKIQQLNMITTFKRLDYLFKVIEFSKSFEKDFVTTCITEIENIMTLDEEEDTNKEE